MSHCLLIKNISIESKTLSYMGWRNKFCIFFRDWIDRAFFFSFCIWLLDAMHILLYLTNYINSIHICWIYSLTEMRIFQWGQRNSTWHWICSRWPCRQEFTWYLEKASKLECPSDLLLPVKLVETVYKPLCTRSTCKFLFNVVYQLSY